MDGDRTYSLLADPDQWARCSHENTALLDRGGVQLTWDEEPAHAGGQRSDEPSGLAFDRWCTAYRSEPSRNRLVAIPVGSVGGDAQDSAEAPFGGDCGVLDRPQGMDVDSAQRLYVAETGAGKVAVMDLWSRRLLERIPVGTGRDPVRRPLDVTARRCGAYVLLEDPASIVIVEGRRPVRNGPRLLRPRTITPLTPIRVATTPVGLLLVLWRAPDDVALVATVDGRPVITNVRGASDFAVGPDGVLVFGGAGGPLRRLRPDGDGWLELEPLASPRFDGGAIAVAPNGRIAFTTPTGFGWTAGPQVVNRTKGRVVSYRLDAGEYRTRWGRLFLDACLPPATRVDVGFVTTDEDEVVEPIDWRRAERSTTPVHRPDHTPPLPSQVGLDGMTTPVPLYRRPTGRESPWAQIANDDRFETYEVPVTAEPGRYLWIVLELSGTTAATPRVRELRVERPGHRLLELLPRSWSRTEADADFLQRLLAPAEGMMHELDERAAHRELLLDPQVVPQEALPWLAGLAGLVLDRRWPEVARRTLVAKAYALFRRQGTLGALTQILGIYLGRDPVILERWRVRGIPGAILGRDPSGPASSVLGGGMRAGGAVRTGAGPVAVQDGYVTAAHRFSVLVPMDLSTEQSDVVRSVLERHKPAHTAFEVCELGYGMRVGRHLHVGLTSFVGPDSGWGPAVVGQVAVGGDGVVGIPVVGSRLGDTSTIGMVRVG